MIQKKWVSIFLIGGVLILLSSNIESQNLVFDYRNISPQILQEISFLEVTLDLLILMVILHCIGVRLSVPRIIVFIIIVNLLGRLMEV